MKVMNVNVNGLFLITQSVLKRCMLPAGKGRIVNVASVAGLQGNDPACPPPSRTTPARAPS